MKSLTPIEKRVSLLSLGGIHPTALPEEAKGHADSVVMGEAEEVWPCFIDDLRTRNLNSFYRQESFTELSKVPRPRREILPTKGYFPLDVIQATRGCPSRCEFCSVRKFFGDSYRFRPISEVVEEMRNLRHRLIMVNGDNILGNPSYSIELLKALVPIKKNGSAKPPCRV
jgi:radical SAM superfamily enzyme YgiQ (UPF0313 family)